MKNQMSHPGLLEVKHYYPIDIPTVKERWHQAMDVVNIQWYVQNVETLLEHVNNTAHSDVMRKFYLNLVPSSVIIIINQIKKEKQ